MATSYTEPTTLNKFWLGFLLGFLFPLCFFLLYYLFRFRNLPMDTYLSLLIQTGKYVHVMSLAVFPNLLPFMLFVRSDRYKAGRGIMTITVLYALTIFAMKFFT